MYLIQKIHSNHIENILSSKCI